MLLRFATSLADAWIGRRARPDARALEAVRGLAAAVVVTGGSRGIGARIAECFAEAGAPHILLVARGEADLRGAAERIRLRTAARVSVLQCDITRADAPQALEAALAGEGLYLDILVNNAGIGLAGPFDAQDAHAIDQLVATNMAAPTRLMRWALPHLLARGCGGILNMASLGGFVPGPHQAAYYASKAYVIALTEAIANETRGRGVRVAVVAPGPVDTGFHAEMGAEGSPYRRFLPSRSPDEVARSAWRGFMLGRTVIVPGVLETISSFALRIAPRTLMVPLVGALLYRTREHQSDRRGGQGPGFS